MISLSAVEDAIRVALDVQELECIAVAVPDPKKGEAIVLLANPNSLEATDADALRKTIISGGIHPLMTPSRIEFVDEVPTLASGKSGFIAARQLALDTAG